MQSTRTIGDGTRAHGEASRGPLSQPSGGRHRFLLYVVAAATLLAIATVQWLLSPSEREGRGAAALAAVAIWLLVTIGSVRLAWAIAQCWFPQRTAVLVARLANLRLRLVLAGGILIASLVAAELAARWWLPTPALAWVANERSGRPAGGDWEEGFCEFDPVLGWRGVPSRRGEFTTAGVRVCVEQNAAGFRDIEHTDAVFDRRLVLLGDSFTWGAGVGQDETVSAQLRRLLDGVDVYNLGVCGYGTDQSLLNFERWSDAIRPTAVCYLFFANDLTDNHSRENHGHAKPYYTLVDGTLRLEGVPILPAVPVANSGSLAESSTSPAALVTQPLRCAVMTADHYVSPHSVLYRQTRRANLEWRRRQPAMKVDSLTAALILELQRRCSRREAEFTVALIPDRGVMKYSHGPEHFAAVRDWCDANGIDCLDLTPALLASPTNPYLFEGHWNATGHRIAAAAIADHFNAQRLY